MWKRSVLAGVLTASAALCAGCPPSSSPGASAIGPLSPPEFNGKPMTPVTGKVPTAAVLFVRAQVVRVAVPFGMISQSERLWRYLDEEIVDPTTFSVLSRNGFRVGRGRLDDWPAVAARLEEMAGRSLERTLHSARPADPMPIVLRRQMGQQRIFTFDRRGELRGKDYPAGDNVLMLTTHLNRQDQSGVLVQVSPLVRSSVKVRQLVQTDAGYVYRNDGVPIPIEGLEFVARVPQGHYLVIGPGAAARRRSSPGHCFLVDSVKGVRRETILVIVPEVFAAELREASE